jgi:hypothetical protein
MKWLASEFDFVAGRYTGAYYDWTSFASVVFVDSDLGDDSFVGGGTEANPWKTLTKAHNDSGTVTGTVIVINGIFTENLSISKQVRIIGCGGGRNGRAIFNNGGGSDWIRITNVSTATQIYLENIETTNYTTSLAFISNSTGNRVFYSANCFFVNIYIQSSTGSAGISNACFFYYTVLKDCLTPGDSVGFPGRGTTFRGSNIILFGCQLTGSGRINFVNSSNNHINNNITAFSSGSNNLFNINGQYFSPANNDFNFPDTSPLYLTGTVDGITGIPNNVGAGRLGNFLNTSKFEFTTVGGAAFTNTEVDGNYVYRSNDTIDGIFRTGVVDMGQVRRGVVIGINNSFQFSSGKLTKLIQETNGLTARQGLDWKLIYGNSLSEIQTKLGANDWLLIEYGKMVTVTVSGSTTYGNADPNFDPNDFITPGFRFWVVEMKFKNN